MTNCKECGARLKKKEHDKGHNYCSFCRNTILSNIDGDYSDDDLAGLNSFYLKRFL